MSRVEDIPVFYAFEHSAIDIDSCVQIIRERFGGTKKYWSFDSFYIDPFIWVMICPSIIVSANYMKLSGNTVLPFC